MCRGIDMIGGQTDVSDEQVLDEYDSVQQQLEVEVSAHLACQQVRLPIKQTNNLNM